MRSRKQKNYTFEYKLHAVELYLSSELSYQELAKQENLRNPGLITKWVNDFRIAGPDALRPKKKGRKKTLDTTGKKTDLKSTKAETSNSVNTNAEYVRELEDELLKLRIENAYLKELRRLRLEEKALLKKQRESFSLRGEFKLKDILAAAGFPKATYMYLKKRFNTHIPHQKITTDTTHFQITDSFIYLAFSNFTALA